MPAYLDLDLQDRRDGPSRPGWFARAESWLDARGRGAWIATMVVLMILCWPIGLAFLAYMIWSKRMFANSPCRKGHGPFARHAGAHFRPTGNTAFDRYREDTLARLEREQEDFEAFLQRLREARDKAEFDQYMEERARAAANTPREDRDA
ncbi:DUF2852 domain-containing protein [Phaeovulum vinaykumarii]|uniref:DUF2852 domain-containing protein n=1 Tax=Phaeovulum vinaykumarii TaxID=407234 RepID=A0A1N7MVD4_9RHOB|nr:DUF2852 domain-containing protein [Phaeovulum vinaykumarii]SIS90056.1 Protein of unknown function [Phaeovulum vinaykumarii]SOC16823.1 uncharacterized protein DUF2852 [Phaeovulum vinaykumarii]